MFTGYLTALITPLSNDGIDIRALENLINWQINQGIQGIVIAGTTGEGTLLSRQEREILIKKSVESVSKRIPLIVGCSASGTDQALDHAKQAHDLGADAVMSTIPFYIKPSFSSIYDHFEAFHAINCPVMVYHHPGRTGIHLDVKTLIDIMALDHIVSIKCSATHMETVLSVSQSLTEGKTLLAGDDDLFLTYVQNGAKGCVSVTSNILPHHCFDVWNALQNYDLKKAQALHEALMPVHEATLWDANPQCVKYMLYAKRFIQPVFKRPLKMPDVTLQNRIDHLLSTY